ncbi:TetR family transcriptional regulator [Corynebacterium pseudotuberculosis]|uniref:TetR/AcrR family transcriptional regulator n=1 Tax=Corynebacterium pseudotuberculosis TaxID=1719 RepID=UPI00065E9A95|nr:TetR family transcriptional regulator [Corynebacterium pseudotuberculosis]AFH91190.2 TetR family transcriptional regulator [Corynebacterium pseudotuberculosis 31]APB11230.1 TetR family transcriptional regulator [Corynebacterium pseudotuberculosis]APB13273.1 TetR family transcriptional regulator [Corynebacterium pseudotuberculosis]APB15318.1 TetR family transcriptional regulator [Corynebacterium pseudotuberculosis]APB17363.1 TetR family transcriptional regulator [Corynebacterium pseudotuberc
MQLSKDLIITASLEILDTYGLADMTMRRLAKKLGVAPGALYWHFKNKQTLIDATARRLLAPLFLLDPNSPPDTVAHKVRAIMLEHRDGAELLSAALTDDVLRKEVEQRIRQAFGEHTYSQLVATTLLHFILGSMVIEQAALQRAVLHYGTEVTPDISASEQEKPQSLCSHTPEAQCDLEQQRHAYAAQFTEGLRLIMAGLKQFTS